MLQRIRDRVSGWIAGVVIALVAGAFILFGVEYYFDQSADNQNEAAKVNGVSITESQLDAAVAQLRQQMQGQFQGGVLPQGLLAQIEDYAMQSLVTQTALFTTLQKDGFRVGMTQVKMMIEQTPEFQENGQFSEAKLMSVLYQANLTPEAFFEHVQSQWLINQVTSGIAMSGFSLPSEVMSQYQLQNQQRAFGYLVIPMQKWASTITVTPAEIKKQYDENQSTYETPAKVSVSYIELSPAQIKEKSPITESEAQQYYQEHITNYQIPKRWVVSQITLPLSDQSKASVVALAFSKNQSTGYTSSVVTLSAMQIDPALQSILSTLSVGGVSKPLRTPNGITILKLQQVLPEQTKSFAQMKQSIMQLLSHQQISAQLTKQSNTLANLTYTNPDSLTPAATALHLSVQTSPLLTQSGDGKAGSLFSNPAVLNAIFSDSVFKSGNNSGLIDLGNGKQIVLRINKKIPSAPIPLDQVSASIKSKLIDKRAEAQAGLLAYQLEQKIKAGSDPATLAKQNGLQWHVVPLMMRHEKSSVPAGIVSQAFDVAHSKAVLFNQHDYAVIVVNQVKNADIKNVSPQVQAKMSQKASALWGQLMQHCFVNSVIAHSKIKVISQAQ